MFRVHGYPGNEFWVFGGWSLELIHIGLRFPIGILRSGPR